MTVEELRDLLNEAVENGYGDLELRFAYQPNYPLQDTIAAVWVDEEAVAQIEEGEKNVLHHYHGDGYPFFYLVTGGQDHDEPYAPSEAFQSMFGV